MPLPFIFLKHPSALWLSWLLALSGAAVASAPPPTAALSAAQIPDVSLLAGTCANCHGPEGRAPSGSAIPSLLGQSAHHLQQRLLAFKAGTAANATVMTRLMKGYDAAQIEALAQWFGTQESK